MRAAPARGRPRGAPRRHLETRPLEDTGHGNIAARRWRDGTRIDPVHAVPALLTTRWPRGLALAVGIFSAVYLALYWGYLQIPEEILDKRLYRLGITVPSAALINLVSPADAATAVDSRIVFGSSSLSIVRGCDGAGAYFLLVAAIAGMSTSWRRLLGGIFAATVFIYVLNQTRILVLYFVLTRRAQWFTPLHDYVFPTLLVLAAVVFFATWVDARHEPASPA